MQSSKSNVTATTLATRKKKMAEMCSLIKYFIRYANKRKDTLFARSMVKWLMSYDIKGYICLNVFRYFTWLIHLSRKHWNSEWFLCRRASPKMQRAAETCDGGPAEFIQLFSLWRRLQQPPDKGHPLCPQVLVWHQYTVLAQSVGYSSKLYIFCMNDVTIKAKTLILFVV